MIARVPPDALRENFIAAMRRAAFTVSVVTTDGDAGRSGVTVSAMCSLSADPCPVLACVHHQSLAAKCTVQNKVFCLNVLGTKDAHLAECFAGRVSAFKDNRFACAAWTTLVTGSPVLATALSSLDCRLQQSNRFGSHDADWRGDVCWRQPACSSDNLYSAVKPLQRLPSGIPLEPR